MGEFGILNRNAGSSDLGIKGLNFLWLNPDFLENRKIIFNSKMHSHSFYEVHFILDGTYIYLSENGQKFIAEKNSFILIPPGTKHRLENKIGSCRKMGLTFSYPSYVNSELVFSNEMYCESNCDWIEFTFSMLAKGLELLNGTEFDVFKNIVRLLITFVTLKKNDSENINVQILSDERFERAKGFIEDNSVRDLSVDEVAEYVCISTKQLGRLFLQNCNTTVSGFIAQERCAKAKKMLEDSTISISEIAENLCFSNKQNFGRFFKRITGLTPSTYREMKGR